MSAPLVLSLAVAAFVTATISGILGMAGGITLLGVMTVLLPASDVVPLHGVVQLGSNSTRTLAFLRYVAWRFVGWFAPGLVIGVAGGWALYRFVLDEPSKLEMLKPFIGVYILVFLVWRRHAPQLKTPPMWSYAFLGLAAGLSTMFVGAVGPLIAPWFLRDDLEKEEVIGTKAGCMIIVHLVKLPAFFTLGYDYAAHLPLLALLIAAVIVGTLLGKRILLRIQQETFVRLFELVLAALAVYLAATPWL